jgi:recombinational DNA repair protein (RecF pathway)
MYEFVSSPIGDRKVTQRIQEINHNGTAATTTKLSKITKEKNKKQQQQQQQQLQGIFSCHITWHEGGSLPLLFRLSTVGLYRSVALQGTRSLAKNLLCDIASVVFPSRARIEEAQVVDSFC